MSLWVIIFAQFDRRADERERKGRKKSKRRTAHDLTKLKIISEHKICSGDRSSINSTRHMLSSNGDGGCFSPKSDPVPA